MKNLMNEQGETKALYDELEHKIQQYTTPAKIDFEVLKDIVVTFNACFEDLEKEKAFLQQFIKSIDFVYVNPPIHKRSKKEKLL